MLARGLAAGLFVLLAGCSMAPVPEHGGSARGYLEVETLAPLDRAVSETSGLAVHEGRLWTLNDSGNGPYLYALAGGRVTDRVRVGNAVNIDWESMAQDEQYLYVADCGNNSGRRQWFQLYRIAWSDLLAARDEVDSTHIEFRLADPSVRNGHQDHDNDCEAIARVGGDIWLLTKGWASGRSRLYRLDPSLPQQSVTAVAEWPVQGLITALDYSPQRQQLALLGYTLGRFSSEAFIWLVPVRDGEPRWAGARRHTLWPSGQWEAVLWQGDELLLTRESSLLGAARIGRVRMN